MSRQFWRSRPRLVSQRRHHGTPVPGAQKNPKGCGWSAMVCYGLLWSAMVCYGLLTAQVADGHVMEFLCRVPRGSPKISIARNPSPSSHLRFIPYSGGLSLTSKLIQTHIRTWRYVQVNFPPTSSAMVMDEIRMIKSMKSNYHQLSHPTLYSLPPHF